MSNTIGTSEVADYEPFKLKFIDEGIWQADGNVIDFFCLPFSIRMFIVQLTPKPLPSTSQTKQNCEKSESEGGHDYWLFSPIQPEPKLIEQIKQLISYQEGSNNDYKPTIYIVYGNCLHHIYAEDWMSEFPDAKLCGPEELITKMKKDPTRQTLKFDYELRNKERNGDNDNADMSVANEERPPWYDEINYFLSDKECNGFIEEVIFYHRRSKSVIVTDLIQNHNVDSCPGYDKKKNFIYRCVGISKKNGGGIPMDYKCGFHFPFGNIQKAKKTLQQALDWWDFDKILITHGDSIFENAKEYYSSFITEKI